MASKHLLRSFAGGEITPELSGRLDLTKYQTGLALCRNAITLPHGPAVRRAGTEFINEAYDSARPVRLIPFSFSADQTAVLEFGHQYIRVFVDGGALLEDNKTVESISGSTVTVTAHGYDAGDWVYIGQKFFRIATAATNSFTVVELGGGGATPSGPLVARVFTLETPYDSADLFDLHYAQSADIVTIVHPNYATRELARQSAVVWTLTEVSFAPPNAAPTGVTATPTIAGSDTDKNKTIAKYVVTSVADDGVTESLPSAPASANNNLTLAGNFNTITWTGVTGYTRYNVYKLRGGVYGYIGQVTPTGSTPKTITSATPYNDTGFFKFARVRVVTSTSHGYTTGDRVFIDGTTYFDGLFAVTVENSTTFTFAKTTQFAFPVTTGTANIPSLSLVDDNVLADTTQTPPEDIVSLNKGQGDYPAATVYHEQRRWFAGTIGKPQVLWATRTGTDNNLTSSIPTRDADGMELRLASSQYNQIRHLVALSDLIALTAGGEFRIFAEGAPAITPTSISIKPQGYAGASNVQPVVTTGSIMYVQAQGSRVREMSYSWEANAYRTVDASIMAPHRFNYHTLTDLAYSRSPDSILWAVRDDGVLLGMTYVPDQQVYGWHAHDTDGKFESVTVVSEGNEDMLYAVVQREIDGRSVRYIERLSTRYFARQEFAYFVDCGLSFIDEGNLSTAAYADAADTTLYNDVEYRPYHYRKVGDNVWLFLQRVVDGSGVAAIDILAPDMSLVSTTIVPALNPGVSDYAGGFALTETGTHFYLWGNNKLSGLSGLDARVVKISKSDPTSQVVTDLGFLSTVQTAFPAANGRSAWYASNGLSAGQFKRWDYEAGAFIETRTGPTGAVPPPFGAVQLANGDLVYLRFNDPTWSIVFLPEDGGYIELPFDSADGAAACLSLAGNPEELWVLGASALYSIDTENYVRTARYLVNGAATIAGIHPYRAPVLLYAADRQVLHWMTTISGTPKLVTFSLQTKTQTSLTYPPAPPTFTSVSEYQYAIAYIDNVVWSSFLQSTGYKIGRLSWPLIAGQNYVAIDEYGQKGEYTLLRVISPTRALVQSLRTGETLELEAPEWYRLRTTFTGLEHLEGKTVQILADGAVHPTRVVTDGAITLEYPAAIVTVGLQYTTDLKTLPLSIESAQAAGQGTMKNVNKVHLRVERSSLVKAGPSFEHLREFPARAVSDNYGNAPALRTGELALSIDPSWNTDAAVCVRQDEPLPLSVLSMTLEVQTGG